MPATLYRSTDSGAPTLAGNTASTLINVLDAILVTGYGSKSPAGWTKPFFGTDKAVFLNGASAVARRYFRISDPLALYAQVRGYNSMTDVDTGSTAFPNTTQRTADLYLHKTSTAAATAREWLAIADARTLVLAVKFDSASGYWMVYYMGDGVSFVSGDAHFAVLAAAFSTSQSSSIIGHYVSDFYTLSDTATTGLYIGGNPGGAGSVLGVIGASYGRRGATWTATTITMSDPKVSWPNIDGSAILNQCVVIQPTNYTGPVMALRGRLRFVYDLVHPLGAFSDYDTFQGVGDLSGKNFTVISKVATTTNISYGSAIYPSVALTADD